MTRMQRSKWFSKAMHPKVLQAIKADWEWQCATADAGKKSEINAVCYEAELKPLFSYLILAPIMLISLFATLFSLTLFSFEEKSLTIPSFSIFLVSTTIFIYGFRKSAQFGETKIRTVRPFLSVSQSERAYIDSLLTLADAATIGAAARNDILKKMNKLIKNTMPCNIG